MHLLNKLQAIVMLLLVGAQACTISTTFPSHQLNPGAVEPLTSTPVSPSSASSPGVTSQPALMPLERVVFTTSDPGLAFAPLYVGLGKGFFREEGLDVEVQVTQTNVSLAALASGQGVDYQATLGTVVRGAVTGLPVRAVGIWYEKTAFYLMARPEIRTIQDLKGKVVGVSSFNASTDIVLREILRDSGIDPETDVTIIQVGTGSTRLGAVSQGAAVASLFTPPDNIIAEQYGLHRVPSLAEALPVPFTGVGVAENTLREKRSQVERMLRATIRTLRFMHEYPRESSELIAEATGADREMTFRAYELMLNTLSPDGWAAPEALDRLVQQSVSPGNTAPPLSAVYDPGPLKAAQQALGIAGRP